jgi:hypothetical protein
MKRPNHSMISIAPIAMAIWFAFAPLPGHCQSQSGNPPAKDSTPTEAKPRKVWTNDNIGDLQSDHGLSVVGAVGGVKKPSAPAKADPNQPDIQSYRKQLASLRADIEKLDGQIATTQAFIDGEKVGGTQTPLHNQFGNPQDQLKQFQQKREADLAKIETIEDSARKKGIEPGALR